MREKFLNASLRRALCRNGVSFVNFESTKLVALNLSPKLLEKSDAEREMSFATTKILAECADLGEFEYSEDGCRWRARAEPVVIRLGRAPLRFLEKMKSLRNLDPHDEEFNESLVYALPHLSTKRRIVEFSTPCFDEDEKENRRRGYDRWRATTMQEEIEFWRNTCGLVTSFRKEVATHATLQEEDGSYVFAPVPRQFIVGESVRVPAATRMLESKIFDTLKCELRRIPWIGNVQIQRTMREEQDVDDDDELARRELEYFRVLLAEEKLQLDASKHTIAQQDDEHAKKKAKLERKLARQLERERRERLKVKKKQTVASKMSAADQDGVVVDDKKTHPAIDGASERHIFSALAARGNRPLETESSTPSECHSHVAIRTSSPEKDEGDESAKEIDGLQHSPKDTAVDAAVASINLDEATRPQKPHAPANLLTGSHVVGQSQTPTPEAVVERNLTNKTEHEEKMKRKQVRQQERERRNRIKAQKDVS